MPSQRRHPFLRRHIAIPQDHGSWVFLFSPLLIGLLTADACSLGVIPMLIAAIAAFMMRQPVSIWVKTLQSRRPISDRNPAIFWSLCYAAIVTGAGLILIAQGYVFVLWLAVPAIPVFGWHLWLVSRRAERHQMGVEIVGSGVLALAAPAAFWVARGETPSVGWMLFILTWLQSAASIVYAYLRLEQRDWKNLPSLAIRFSHGRRALLYTGFNLIFVSILSLGKYLPPLLPIPYTLQFAETTWGIINPAIGVKPTRIGIRQLIISTLFTIIFILVW